ncbi:TPA: sce7726 family protein [Vibrio parahaemolyticus]|nr:sce7726 family protein [Vibrio parahaemolyticus]
MNNGKKLRDIALKFSPAAMKRLIDQGVDEIGSLGSTSQHGMSVAKWYETAYSKLVDEYRNEYVYKNAIAEKIIRGRHKLSNKCFYATEFRIRSSIADALIANGTTTAYEIKTEYDSFERLAGQLADYAKACDRIYVVIPSSKIIEWAHKIPVDVGILALTPNYTLQQIRESESHIEQFDMEALFSCFRRKEFINAIQNQFGFVPNCKPVELKSRCRELFLTLDKSQAHKEFLLALKSRQIKHEQIQLIKEAPPALISALLSVNLSLKEISTLNQVLREVI